MIALGMRAVEGILRRFWLWCAVIAASARAATAPPPNRPESWARAGRAAPRVSAVTREGRTFEMSGRVREALQVVDHVV
jgi:hypothetical protein